MLRGRKVLRSRVSNQPHRKIRFIAVKIWILAFVGGKRQWFDQKKAFKCLQQTSKSSRNGDCHSEKWASKKYGIGSFIHEARLFVLRLCLLYYKQSSWVHLGLRKSSVLQRKQRIYFGKQASCLRVTIARQPQLRKGHSQIFRGLLARVANRIHFHAVHWKSGWTQAELKPQVG